LGDEDESGVRSWGTRNPSTWLYLIILGNARQRNKYISYNDGLQGNSGLPIMVGPDLDAQLADTDPAGANLRYRHSGRIVVLLVAGNAQAYAKGRVTEGQVYTDY
jgi:hypothetical protein